VPPSGVAPVLSLRGRRRAGRVAVQFYRGGWCPYCNIALRTYQAQLVPALAERGIRRSRGDRNTGTVPIAAGRCSKHQGAPY